VAPLPGGRVLLAVAGGRRIRFWDLASCERLRGVVDCGSPVRCAAAVPLADRTLIAWGADDGLVRLCDAASREAVGAPLGGGHGVVLAVAAEDGLVATGTADGTLALRDPLGGTVVLETAGVHDGPVRAVAFGRTGRRRFLVSGGDDRVLHVLDLDEDTTFTLPVDVPIGSLLCWEDGVFVGSHSGLVHVGLPT
jgi:WD40 repeat protein